MIHILFLNLIKTGDRDLAIGEGAKISQFDNLKVINIGHNI